MQFIEKDGKKDRKKDSKKKKMHILDVLEYMQDMHQQGFVQVVCTAQSVDRVVDVIGERHLFDCINYIRILLHFDNSIESHFCVKEFDKIFRTYI